MPEIKLVYQQIKEYIENEAKDKKPGEYLSSEVQYSSLFNVSRPTVRKAVDILAGSGLVKRVPGKGLMVAEPQNTLEKGNILFAIPFNPEDGFFYTAVMGCIDAANKSGFGYKIINKSTPSSKLKDIKETDLEDYSAAVLTVHNKYDYDILNILTKKHIPYVLIDNPAKNVDCPYVITDDYKGGYISAEYLIKKGHTQILYITLKNDINTIRTREQGFRKAFQDNGIQLPEKYIIYMEHDDEIHTLLPETKLEYTAVCSYSDLPVIRAYNVLNDMGVQIPEQVSLMGYGNFKYSELLKVPLTTVSLPVYKMGYKAVEIAANMVKGSDIIEKVVLDVNIVERQSVAAII